jgi:HEPN domain-containing protein
MYGHESWLKIAQDDLKAAKALVKINLFAASTYHCQQSAEKSLKGYLAFKKQEILKTHDLTKLIELCKEFDTVFDQYYPHADYLNPFTTRCRYPTEFDIPNESDTKEAIKYAQNIMKLVLKKTSTSNTDQLNIFDHQIISEKSKPS